MQDKVTFNPPPPQPSIGGKSPQESQILFTKVMDFLEALSQQEKLEVILKIARDLQHAQVQVALDASLAKAGVSVPDADAIWKKILNQLENGKSLLPLLKQLASSAQKKDAQTFAKDLEQISKFLLTPEENPVSPQMQDILEKMLDPLLEEGGELFEGSLNGFLIKNFFGSQLVSLKKQGFSTSEILKFLLGKLEKEAHSFPPTLFSETAKALLQLVKEKGESFVNTFLKQAEQGELDIKSNAQLASLFKDLLNLKGVQQSLAAGPAAFEEAASTKNAFRNYREAIRAHMTEKYCREATQSSFQSEMSYLKQILQQLEKYDPNDPQIQQYESLISELSQNSQLSPTQFQQLTSAIQGIFNIINEKVPSSQQINFLEGMKHLLDKMMQDNNNYLSQLKSLLNQVGARLSVVDGVSGDINEIQTLLQYLEDGKNLTPSQIQKFSQSIAALMEHYGDLSSSEQTEVMNAFSALGNLLPTQGNNIQSILSDALLFSLVQQYGQSHQPNPSVTGLNNWLKQQLSAFQNEMGQNPFMKGVIERMNGTFNQSGFPDVTGFLGLPFASGTGNTFTPNSNYWSGAVNYFSITATSAEQALQAYAPIMAFFEKDYISIQEQSESLLTTLNSLNKLGAILGQAKQGVQAGIYAGGSLPDDFAHVVLNHYMVQQEAYLMALASLLFFFNFGANMDNQFLNQISGWENSSINYNFAKWFNSGGSKDTTAQIESQLNNELNQANSDLSNAEKLQQELQQKLQEIENLKNEGKLTTKQANQMESQINNELGSVGQAITNLQNLIGDLKTALYTIEPPPNGKGQTLTSAQVTQIQNDENSVVKGDPTNNGYGGLQTIYSDISNDQIQWSGQSQEQQIMLQMRMTQIQQEWTVVATAIQLLNQMYMTPAQAIYK